MIAFEDISYLQQGTSRQRAAYHTLTAHGLLSALESYDPILVGTIPINIDIETSDLDIICYWQQKLLFIQHLQERFNHYPAFSIWEQSTRSGEAVVASFQVEDFEVEVFGQNIPTQEQYAYRHLIIEEILLQQKGNDFRQQVIALKQQGLKTEPAFAQLLGLTGDPYAALLTLEKNKT
jgi:hypothetical protein